MRQRKYYVTLCGDYFGKYAIVSATDKFAAIDEVVKTYGVLNVSKAYTETSWKNKYTECFSFIG